MEIEWEKISKKFLKETFRFAFLGFVRASFDNDVDKKLKILTRRYFITNEISSKTEQNDSTISSEIQINCPSGEDSWFAVFP